MAKLPDAEAFGAPPTPTAGRGIARIRPTSGFEGVPAQEMTQSARELESASHIVLQMKEQQDTLRAEDGLNKLRQAQIAMTYGKDGFANLQGENAVNQPVLKSYGVQFDQAAARLAATLDNTYQRELFQRRAELAGLEFRQGIVKHIARETDVYATAVLNSTVATEVNAATANPETTALSLVRIDAGLTSYAERFGQPQEWVTAKATEARSTIYAAQIRTALAHDPLTAKAYFDAHASELSAQDRPVLENQLRQSVLPIEAKTIADAAMQAMTASARKGDTRAQLGDLIEMGDSLAEQQHPNDPVFRDLVATQIKSYIATRVAVQDGISKQAYGALLTAAMGPQGGAKPLTVDQLLGTPAARQAWLLVEPAGQRGILALLEHNALAAQGTPMRESSAVVESLLNRMYLPSDHPLKIRTPAQLVPYFGRGLNRPAMDWLKVRMDELQTPEGQKLTDTRNAFFSGVKGQFDKSTITILDIKGGEDFYKFKHYATQRELEYRKTPGKDPYQLYNPSSPDYLGRSISAFQRSLAQQLHDLSSSLDQQGATPNVPVAPAAPEIVNKATGERRILKDGVWQKP
jgi:hypothetical protein